NHLRQDVGPLASRGVDFSGQWAGVLGEDAGPLVGREQVELKRGPLPEHLAVAVQEHEPGPGEAEVTGDLLRAEQELREALRGPAFPVLRGVFRWGGPVPERNRDAADQDQGQNQPKPLTMRLLRRGNRHAAGSRESGGPRPSAPRRVSRPGRKDDRYYSLKIVNPGQVCFAVHR